MRQVEVCKDGWFGKDGFSAPKNICVASFHCFLQSGDQINGMEPVAVVEYDSGLIDTVYAGKMRFTGKPAAEICGAGSVQPITTQGTKPCAGCKHANDNEEYSNSPFAKCALCSRNNKDYFERTASPVA